MNSNMYRQCRITDLIILSMYISKPSIIGTHQCLHHPHALCTEVSHTLVYTESPLSLHLLHHHIQSDESPSATHTCTAVHQQWLVQGDRVQFTHMTNETDDRHDIVWYSMIWPGSIVELSDSQWILIWC